MPPAVIDRLRRAWNDHDLEALTECFHSEYESVHPLHPERCIRSSADVRRSWAQVFSAIPDVQAELCRWSATGDSVWTEWLWQGRHIDGVPFRACGVMIFGLAGDRIGWARVYTETDPTPGPDIDAVLEDILSRAVWP